MVFGSSIVSSPRGSLSPIKALHLAKIYLENAGKEQDPDIALVLCHDTEVSLSQAKKAARHTENRTLHEGISTAYIDLGNLLHNHGRRSEANAIYKKAEKSGYGQ